MALQGGLLDVRTQTADPWQDRRYLENMSLRRDALGVEARNRLEALDRQDALQESIRGRQEAEAGRKDVREAAVAERTQRDRETAQARRDALELHRSMSEEANKNRALEAIKLLPPDKQGPMLNQFLTQHGYNVGGGATDKVTEDARQFAGQPAPPTAAPAAPGGVAAPPADITGGGAVLPQESRQVMINRLSPKDAQGNPTHDYNVSTGQWVPRSTQGMIGGRPAGEVIAAGARPGVMPESPSGIAGLRTLAAQAAPNPPTREAMTPTGPTPFIPSPVATPGGTTAATPPSPSGGPGFAGAGTGPLTPYLPKIGGGGGFAGAGGGPNLADINRAAGQAGGALQRVVSPGANILFQPVRDIAAGVQNVRTLFGGGGGGPEQITAPPGNVASITTPGAPPPPPLQSPEDLRRKAAQQAPQTQ